MNDRDTYRIKVKHEDYLEREDSKLYWLDKDKISVLLGIVGSASKFECVRAYVMRIKINHDEIIHR